MDIRDIAAEVWRRARQGQAQQRINVEGNEIRVTCVRQVCDCGCHVRFIFWMNHNGVPQSLVRRVRSVFLPNGVMYPGKNGELIQYIQEVRVPTDREIRRLLAARPLPPPSGQDYRASGDALCPVCEHPIRLHPLDPDELSHDKQPFLVVLCNGDRVKT